MRGSSSSVASQTRWGLRELVRTRLGCDAVERIGLKFMSSCVVVCVEGWGNSQLIDPCDHHLCSPTLNIHRYT